MMYRSTFIHTYVHSVRDCTSSTCQCFASPPTMSQPADMLNLITDIANSSSLKKTMKQMSMLLHVKKSACQCQNSISHLMPSIA